MANQIGKNEGPREESFEDDQLFAQCRQFLEHGLPSSNIILDTEFGEFMPLYNKQMSDRLDAEEKTKLTQKYFGRFSAQHPVQIISRELDPNGIYYPKDKKKHKVVKTIPAFQRQVQTLNKLGIKVPTLINAFFNASVAAKNNPIIGHQKQQAFTQSIIQALTMAQQKDPNLQKQYQDFIDGEKKLLSENDSVKTSDAPSSSENSDNEESMTGIIDWG